MNMMSLPVFRPIRAFGYGLLMLLSVCSLQATAQGVQQQTNTGTVEALSQDDGSLTISGVVYAYDDEVSELFLRGEPVSSGTLNVGMVVRFTVNNNGVLTRIEILGPFNQIRLLLEN